MEEHAVISEDLTINFGKTSILWEVTFQIPKGVIVGVMGPNGAGKSTLLKAALGLVRTFSGKISVFGDIAYIPQRGEIDWDFPITAEEVVLMGRYGHLGLFKRPRSADIEAVRIALEKVGMSAYAHRQISQLSGGQQQRLFIARALVQQADILLLDEPFIGIDLTSEKMIMDLLRKQKDLGKTILIVHHDLQSAEEYFDWGLLLNNRLLGFGPLKEVFTKEHLAKTFGKHQWLFDEAANLTVKSRSGIL